MDDSLSFIDREFDDPNIQQYVRSLVQLEMDAMINEGMGVDIVGENQYIAAQCSHLGPYPELKFSNSAHLQTEYKRVQSGKDMDPFNTSRYTLAKLGNDPTAAFMKQTNASLKSSISNAQAQIMHRENELMNLEVTSETTSDIWLAHNKALEKLPAAYSYKMELLKRKIRNTTIACKHQQEKAYPEIASLTKKRTDSFVRMVQCKWAVDSLAVELEQRGVSVEAFDQAQQKLKRRKLDPNNSEFNSTVRQYEAITSSS